MVVFSKTKTKRHEYFLNVCVIGSSAELFKVKDK